MAVKKIAVMHSTYVRANDKSGDDLVYIKERILDTDGTETVNTRLIENYIRSYYVLKECHRSEYKYKREYESLDRLVEYKSTQSNMAKGVAKALGKYAGYASMYDLGDSPYVYGTDISTTSLIKYRYGQHYPEYAPDATVAVLDLETNVLNDVGEPIYGAVTYKDKAILAVTKAFLGTTPTPEATLHKLFDKYLGEFKTKRNIKLEIHVVDDDFLLIRKLFGFLHTHQPDLVAIWNMSFDINVILKTLERHNVPPETIFCDPKLPNKYKTFNFREGKLQKVTASGKFTANHYADLWHVVTAPASFYFVDAMCFFKANRVREQARHSYSLDAILKTEINQQKLRFKEADGYTGLQWHQVMQRDYKLEYGIYNLFDCISMELLDEHTNDLSKALLGRMPISDLSNLKSGPKILADKLHFFHLSRKNVIACTSKDMTEDLDSLVLGRTGWIVTVASELLHPSAMDFISDAMGAVARIFTNVADIDISSGYPFAQIIGNISKETTVNEVCAIVDMDESEQRRLGVNLTACRSNALDLGQCYYKLPTLDTLLANYKEDSRIN